MGNQGGAVGVLEVIDSVTELGMQEVWRGRALKRRKEREGAGRDPHTVHRPDKVQPNPEGRFQANTAQHMARPCSCHWSEVVTDPEVPTGGGCQLPMLPAAK